MSQLTCVSGVHAPCCIYQVTEGHAASGEASPYEGDRACVVKLRCDIVEQYDHSMIGFLFACYTWLDPIRAYDTSP